MESACLRYTEIPHTSRLFLDFQYHFDRVAQFYRSAANTIEYPPERRQALIAALRTTNGASAAEQSSLNLLAREGTVAVVTGQQVGLFSGPAYTIYKALTAVRLAEKLTQEGRPAVPVFWLATEDHDFAEINHTFVFDPSHEPVKLMVNGRGESSQQPVGSIAVTAAPLDHLRRVLDGFPSGPEITPAVERAYRTGVTFGAAFEDLLRNLLGKWGLLFVDPMNPAVRKIAAPLLHRAVDRAGDLKQRLLERNQALQAAGYHAQVHVEPQTSLFFLLDGNRRTTLRRENGEYLSKDRRYSVQELADRAEQLSPNALLRPVMQDYILPTAAYVGGPAELAYLAQSQVLYDELLGRMPVPHARSGFTLLDQHSAKAMRRYGLELRDLFHSRETVRELIARVLIPADLSHEFERVKQSTAQSLDRLGADLTQFDPTLAAALEKSAAKILYQLSKIECKAARETLRRDDRAEQDARSLSGLVYPEKHLQERFYSILPFLAKHGLPLLDTLYDNVHPDCPDHKILIV